jgi:hypothetical protein
MCMLNTIKEIITVRDFAKGKIFSALLFTGAVSILGIHAQIVETRDIYTGFEPRLAEVQKFQDNPSIKDTFPSLRDTVYDFRTVYVESKFIPDTITALKLRGEPMKRLHRLLAQGAMGNYTSFWGDIHFQSIRNKSNSYYLNYTHFSSAGTISERGRPNLSDNVFSGGYQHRFKSFNLGIDGGIDRNVVHYYGYNPEIDTLVNPDSTRQRFARYHGQVYLNSAHRTDSIRLNYSAKVGFYHMADLYGTAENRLSVRSDFNKFTDLFAHEFLGADFALDWFSLSRAIAPDFTNPGLIISVNPYMMLGGDFWKMKLGVGITGAGSDSTFVGFFPKLDAHLNVFRKYIILYGLIDGSYTRQTLHTLQQHNPFLMSHIQLADRRTPFQTKVGIKGAFSDHISYDLGMGYDLTHNAFFFLPDTLDFQRRGFIAAYDRLQTLSFTAAMHYQLGEKLSVGIKGNYYVYTTDVQQEAWYRPNMDITLNARYNLGNKIIAAADIFFIGSQQGARWARDLNNEAFVVAHTINPLFDMNLSGTYRLNRNFSFFMRLNNLAAFRYNRFFDYPTFGFNLLGGISVAL